MKRLFRALALASWASLSLVPLAFGQSAVTTYPAGVATTNASSTITLSLTFQQVFAQNSSRRNCVIQNTSIGTMWVFFGSIGSAATATSFPLFPASAAGQPGGYISCASSGVVVTDQVSITGTTAATFTAVQQ